MRTFNSRSPKLPLGLLSRATLRVLPFSVLIQAKRVLPLRPFPSSLPALLARCENPYGMAKPPPLSQFIRYRDTTAFLGFSSLATVSSRYRSSLANRSIDVRVSGL